MMRLLHLLPNSANTVFAAPLSQILSVADFRSLYHNHLHS